MNIEDLVIQPKLLTFLTTFQCTAACTNCCFGCNPTLKKRLSLEQMKEYTDQALNYYGNSIKVLVLTGGECFLLGDDLTKIVEYGTIKGLITRVVTNGYWAKSYQEAYDTLLELRENGLQEINFSTGDDHQKWVPYENIANGCMASMDLGLTCAVNVEMHDNSIFSADTLKNDSRLSTYFDVLKYKQPLRIEQGIWIPFDKDSIVTYDRMENKESLSHMRCTSIFRTIPINPYSNMSACCGLPSEHIIPLRLGNVQEKTIKELYESQFLDFLKIWLFLEGPHEVLKYINEKRGVEKKIVGHICYACAEIFKDEKNIQWIKDNYNEIMPSIMFKYLTLKTTLA